MHRAAIWIWILLGCQTLFAFPGPRAKQNRAARQTKRDQLLADVQRLRQQGKPKEAIVKALAALPIHREISGSGSVEYATFLNQVAAMLYDVGDYRRAVPLCKEALGIALKHVDKNDPSKGHALVASSVNNLANLHARLHEFAQAEPLYRQAIALRKEAFGDDHPTYARSIFNLAEMYYEMGDLRLSLRAHQQAFEIRKQLGDHVEHAGSLNALAILHVKAFRHEMAKPLAIEARDIFERSVGKSHWAYGSALNTLGMACAGTGDYPQAAACYEQALAIFKQAAHPGYVSCLGNLADLMMRLGDFTRAESICIEALQLVKTSLGSKHPGYARHLNALSHSLLAQGKAAEAKSPAAEALQIVLRAQDEIAGVQSERQRLLTAQFDVSYLNTYLTAAVSSGEPSQAILETVLAWKGATTADYRQVKRQQQARRTNPRSEAGQLVEKLDHAVRDFCAQLASVPTEEEIDEYRLRTRRAHVEIEDLQRGLATLERKSGRPARKHRFSADKLRGALPAGTALVEFVEYAHYVPPGIEAEQPDSPRRLLGFVMTRGSPVEHVDLGESAVIEELVEAWRRDLLRPTDGEGRSAGAELRRRVWKPLAACMGETETVLISPSGALSGLSWAALPGEKEGTYLAEERSFSVLAVPEMLPELVARRAAATPGSLLVLCDVDFGKEAQEATEYEQLASRSRDTPYWRGLEGTKREGSLIQAAFLARFPAIESRTLIGAGATEDAFRQLAPQHRYLHIATHGFFVRPLRTGTEADPPRLEVGAVLHPGVLSGIVFAGANMALRPGRDDELLTAWEISTLDLQDVDLATLSACETGLGHTIGFEGLRGLQQAFQIAGARTTVSSLWKVPDSATQVLMGRFYENLWAKKMGKLAALREAQIWMLRDVAKNKTLRAEATRGLDLENDALEISSSGMPPFYWAAFVLSGDWR